MKEDKAKRLKKIISNAPKAPGIYKMIDKDGLVIYIGKANSIKHRLGQYFQKNYSHSTRTEILLEKVENIEFIAVDSELEAVIFEHNLIKQLKPKYNVIMKDDKSYIYIKITNEDFPRIELVRKPEKDNAKYIGPKTSTHKVKNTLKLLKSIFPYRHCALKIKELKENPTAPHIVEVQNKVIEYPCLDYHIKKCQAPCIGAISSKKYKETIKNVRQFLEGKGDSLISELKEKMQNYAIEKKFEKAAKIRDKLQQIESIMERQKISSPDKKDTDIINYLINDQRAYFNLFQIRNGTLTGQENFILDSKLEKDGTISSEVLETFIKDYYLLASDLAKEILIPHSIENEKEITDFLLKERNSKIKIIIPKIGNKNKLLEMSLNNAKIFADRHKPSWKEESTENEDASKSLSKLLKIKSAKRMECYDISHFGGTNTVASMVVFENGVPKSKDYRKFILKTLNNQIDDFKSMEEVLTRRLAYLTKEQIQVKKIKNKNSYEISTKETSSIINLEYPKEKTAIITEEIDEKIIKNIKQILIQISKKEQFKKLYIRTNKKQLDLFMTQGFEEIKKVPEFIEKKKKNEEILCFYTYKHKEDESFNKSPDLIIIDGGKGQLKSAKKALKKLEIKIPVISIAKKLEEIFIPGKKESIILKKSDSKLKLIQRIRDEAHRFAISFQKNSRTF